MRNREAAGFLLSILFVGLAALRDVYFGGLFQRVHPLVVAVVAFALCPLVFLPMALLRDRAGLTALLRRPRELLWINATTALAWLSFFHALRLAEPALVQVIFFGIGPLSVRWLDRLVPGATASAPTLGERRLHVGLLAALGLAAAVMLCGRSGLGPQPLGRVVVALALTAGGGLAISLSTLLCRVVNDAGVPPAAVIGLRFPLAAVAGAGLATARGDVLATVTPDLVPRVALASLALIVLPNYVSQIGIALASPLTVRAVLAVGPVLVFLLETLEGRLPASPFTLLTCVIYGTFALTTAVGRLRQEVADEPTHGRRRQRRDVGLGAEPLGGGVVPAERRGRVGDRVAIHLEDAVDQVERDVRFRL